MPSKKSLFLKHVAQTSRFPMIVEIERAEGMYIYDVNGKAYLDMDSGFSVSSLGHRHPNVITAITSQLDKYLHTTVYGEHIQSPQVEYATLLANTLNCHLTSLYYANGGAEAVEIAMKCARKFTNRYEIFSCKNAYHGSTLGAESLRSDLDYTSSFVPAVPGIRHLRFNNVEDLYKITTKTACVILEPIQAEAGIISPKDDYLGKLRAKCDETGTLLVFDEIQTGFGRTGKLFAFQKYSAIPDILLIAKAMGGGMPIAGMLTSTEIVEALCENPSLGHINTFGGHPICVSAALATLKTLLSSDFIGEVERKQNLLIEGLQSLKFKSIRADGLFMGVQIEDKTKLSLIVDGLREQGVLVDYFLFNDDSFRIAPPLIIEDEHIQLFIEKLKLVLSLI
jgi:acetylornithine/N-succinyldiaminopimelate aminotransferase